MKKIVGILAAAALAASAFAEINIGSWNRAVFVPFAYDGDTVRSLEGVSWSGTNFGGAGVRTGLGFKASTENAGLVMDIHANPGDSGEEVGLGDNAYVWVKPAEIFKVAFGKIDNHSGRLDECFGDWDSWRMGNVTVGEGIAGVDSVQGTGAELTLTPIEGLIIDYQATFAGKDDNGTYEKDTYEYKAEGATTHTKGSVKETIGNARAYKVWWENASMMVGYKAGFGFIRAIVRGQPAGTKKNGTDTAPWAKISVAADITAVENMAFKVGATIPTMLDSGNNLQDIQFGAGADFNFAPVAFHLVADMALSPKAEDDGTDKKAKYEDFKMKIGAGVDYDINDALTAVAAVRFANDKVVKDGAFGVYAGLTQKLSNASINYGVELGKNVGPSAKADDFTFAVPVTITASF